MNEIHIENYYPGDSAWQDYAECFKEDWKGCTFKCKLVKSVNGDKLLAMAIYGIFFESSLKWLNMRIPALDNLPPYDCVKSDEGLLKLKTVLMRMP